jgi:hypothetical protein
LHIMVLRSTEGKRRDDAGIDGGEMLPSDPGSQSAAHPRRASMPRTGQCTRRWLASYESYGAGTNSSRATSRAVAPGLYLETTRCHLDGWFGRPPNVQARIPCEATNSSSHSSCARYIARALPVGRFTPKPRSTSPESRRDSSRRISARPATHTSKSSEIWPELARGTG